MKCLSGCFHGNVLAAWKQAFGMLRLRKEPETLRNLAIALQLLGSEFAAWKKREEVTNQHERPGFFRSEP
jgi:hypothetical protein